MWDCFIVETVMKPNLWQIQMKGACLWWLSYFQLRSWMFFFMLYKINGAKWLMLRGQLWYDCAGSADWRHNISLRITSVWTQQSSSLVTSLNFIKYYFLQIMTLLNLICWSFLWLACTDCCLTGIVGKIYYVYDHNTVHISTTEIFPWTLCILKHFGF